MPRHVLFNSLSGHAGTSSLGILLTGMCDDGASGLLALKQAGGHTVIQDEASARIWGMLKSAKELGAANQELSPSEIVRIMMKAAGVGIFDCQIHRRIVLRTIVLAECSDHATL